MKYVVKAAGLYHLDDYFAFGEGFPASLKGFDYKDALERGLIEESKDGLVSPRPDEAANSSRVSGKANSGNDPKAKRNDA